MSIYETVKEQLDLRAVAGVAFHAFEWIFVRLAPIILAGGIAGILLTRKKA